MIVKAFLSISGKSLVSLILFAAGCATHTPADRFGHAALRAGLTAGEVEGAGFRHRTYASPAGSGHTLFVYFGGDGTPFVRRDTVARDPTPRQPLTLQLLDQGPRPAVLLGRPCYHGLTDGCDASLWTTGRYSEAVVRSMAAATERLLEGGAYRNAVLVGYSGGGALAVLVAERLVEVQAVVTFAANLDTGAWTELHGYTPLTASLNPADVAGGRSGLIHLHLSGAADRNVPPPVQRLRLAPRLPPGSFRTVMGFDHVCCWARAWPAIAAEILARLEDRAD